MMDVVGTFLRGEIVKELAEDHFDLRNGACVGLAEQRLELGKELLDRVEVWAVIPIRLNIDTRPLAGSD